ncbi:MAG: SPFH domain-containing protein [Parachlamydiaceae bacterium]
MVSYLPGVHQIPDGHVAIAERYGQFSRVLRAGLNWVNPFTTGVKDLSEWKGAASKCNYLMEMTEQQLETNHRRCYTRDGVTVDATAVIYYKISDPIKAVYQIDVLPRSLQDVCLQVLRTEMGKHSFSEVFSDRIVISQNITNELAAKVNQWGVTLTTVEVGRLDCDDEMNRAMQKKRVAESERDAALVVTESAASKQMKEAETELKVSEIRDKIKQKEAETAAAAEKIDALSKAEAVVIAAEANAKAQIAQNQTIADLAAKIGSELAAKIFNVSQASKNLLEFAKNPNNKIIALPSDLKGMVNFGLDGV